jgi:hypothetical protein
MSTVAMLESPLTDDTIATTSPQTLFDLVATLQDSGEPGEENLIVPTLLHLFQSRRVIWKTRVPADWSNDDE